MDKRYRRYVRFPYFVMVDGLRWAGFRYCKDAEAFAIGLEKRISRSPIYVVDAHIWVTVANVLPRLRNEAWPNGVIAS